jgi:CheY-like chemotaxis protein
MSLPEPILIVDDEIHIRRFLGLLVRQLGATRVIEATCGESALALMAAERPGLVLLDINMPGLSGTETLREIRARDQEIPVIMLTSLTSRQIIEESLALGADSFIRKDTPPQEICRILMELFIPAALEGDGL